MRVEEPYFMKDKKWFYFDEEEFKYKLTKEAPPEAKKSYNDYYKLLDKQVI